MKYYLYRHIRLDKNEPFYVGVGTVLEKYKLSNNPKYYYRRAYTNQYRNRHWLNITKLSNYEVEIIVESNNHEFILLKEKEFVKLYGRRDLGEGTLVNLTDGGDCDYRRSKETCRRISDSTKGVKKRPYKKNISEELRKELTERIVNSRKASVKLKVIYKDDKEEIYESIKSCSILMGLNEWSIRKAMDNNKEINGKKFQRLTTKIKKNGRRKIL